MFHSRRRKALEEAKKDPNFRPDSELEVDESSLEPEQKGHYEIPITAIIVFAILAVLMIACIIVICVIGNKK